MRLPKQITGPMVLRMAADAVMVNVALFAAFFMRWMAWVWLADTAVSPTTASAPEVLFRDALWSYAITAPVLTFLCLVTFLLSGFYTYGRAYQSKYKVIIIAQSVSIAYLIFGAAEYFFFNTHEWSSKLAWFPRSVWLTAWGLTLALIIASRFWAYMWRRAVWSEAKMQGRPKGRTLHHVAVIGGAGYIGSILCRKLLDRGFSVSVLDGLVYGDEGIKELYGRKGFDLIEDDFRNIESVIRVLQHADAVVHLGALVGDPACALDERLTKEINLLATRMVAEAARGYGIERFVFASTCSVYGAGSETLDEKSKLNPVSLYAQTKMESESLLLSLNDDNFSPTILRFATVYGLSPRPRFDLAVNVLTAMAVQEKKITIFGGQQWRPFVHVDDIAEVIMRVLTAPLVAVKGETINVGSDEQNYQIQDLGPLIKKIVPDCEIIEKGEDVDRRDYRVSFAKLRRLLNFTPNFTVEDGVREIAEAVKTGRLADFRDAKYSNHKTLSEGVRESLRSREMSPLYGGYEISDTSTSRMSGAPAPSSPQV